MAFGPAKEASEIEQNRVRISQKLSCPNESPCRFRTWTLRASPQMRHIGLNAAGTIGLGPEIAPGCTGAPVNPAGSDGGRLALGCNIPPRIPLPFARHQPLQSPAYGDAYLRHQRRGEKGAGDPGRVRIRDHRSTLRHRTAFTYEILAQTAQVFPELGRIILEDQP